MSKIRSQASQHGAAPLKTSWEVRQQVGEAPSVIRVRNLTSSISGPQDAWGRKGTTQPIVVTAEASMQHPFHSSASTDVVSHDTVHYGLLSKRILATLRSVNENSTDPSRLGLSGTLPAILGEVFGDLTGSSANGMLLEKTTATLFDSSDLGNLAITLRLPKASLLGSGVSLTASVQFQCESRPSAVQRSMTASIHNLRVPTLVGVNAHERKARQIVVASVEVDRFDVEDINFGQLEEVVVKTMEESSFETLEALTSVLAIQITVHLKAVYEAPDDAGWKVKICLEKPTAVVLAEAACVELKVNTNDVVVPS